MAITTFAMLVGPGCRKQPADEKAARPAAVEAPAQGSGKVEPSDSHYGVYLNGHKVGWMRSQVQVAQDINMTLELHAKVGGMGTVSEILLRESRRYNHDTGQLLGLTFEQEAATGTMRAKGEVEDGQLVLSIEAGKQITRKTVPVKETLDDALATLRLAKEATEGATATGRRFDPSVLKVVEAEHRVVEVSSRLLAGVATKTVKIESKYPNLGISETSWMDTSGTVLESQVGGFFVARLEPPEQAKQQEYSQDLLVSAVVKAPQGVAGATNAQKLELTFTGFGQQVPPSSDRQTVQPDGEQVLVSLERDAPIAATEKPGDAADYLVATPFIQSDSEEIRSRAKEVVGDATDLPTQIERLTYFVYEHVRDEYVPAYSNALEALHSGRGDCTEHSILFVALARALGIPARVAVGIAYWPAGAGFGWHAWAEVKTNERWVAVDPTWNQPVADVTHVKLADGGPAEQARIVMLLGQLKILNAKVGS